MGINSYAPKRLFLGLILTSVVIFSVLMYYIWHLGANQDVEIYRVIFTGIVVGGLILMAAIIAVVGGMVITIIRSESFSLPLLQNMMRFTLGYFFPVVLYMGKIFRIQKQQIMQSFIQVNNQMVMARKIKTTPDRLLMLLPHCVQQADCKHKITRDIENCKQCGACPVSDLMQMSRKYGVHMRVATGGTLARQVVQQLRPKAIVAVACERDLVSGILDCMPLPVYGVLNVRPHGPCFNTQVILPEIDKAIESFIEETVWSELDEPIEAKQAEQPHSH